MADQSRSRSEKLSQPDTGWLEKLKRRLYPLTEQEVLERLPSRPGYEVVRKPIPFAHDLTGFILHKKIDLNQALPHAAAYRGFDYVRAANLVTPDGHGTGFEGYGIGVETDGRVVIEKIAQVGQRFIDSLKRKEPHTWRTTLRELWDTLDEKKVTAQALNMLEQMFIEALMLGQQRIEDRFVAQRYRDDTAKMIKAAPQIFFYFPPSGLEPAQLDHRLHNAYYRAVKRNPIPGLVMNRYEGDPEQLLRVEHPELVEGWQLMSLLGKMGHPAVRVVTEQYGYANLGIGTLTRSSENRYR